MNRRHLLITVLVSLVIVAITILLERWMGRIWICTCGVGVWTSSSWSSETSQLFADPYSLSHLLHGIIFFGALWLLRKKIPMRYLFVISLVIEAAWEVFENSSFIIDRYRSQTASLDYTGDSILNSTGDIVFAMLGFWLAYKLPWKWTLAIVLVSELLMLVFMRDNLTLNVLMLLYPIKTIQKWQMAG